MQNIRKRINEHQKLSVWLSIMAVYVSLFTVYPHITFAVTVLCLACVALLSFVAGDILDEDTAKKEGRGSDDDCMEN